MSYSSGFVKRHTHWILALAIGLSVLGAYVSQKLMDKHAFGSTGSQFLDDLCVGDAESSLDCGVVLASDWAYFPPKDADGKVRPFSLPVALLGMWYFSALTLWYLFVGRPDYEQRRWHLLPLIGTAVGVAGSVFFTGIMFTRIEARCLLCLGSHGINAMLLACAILLRPTRTVSTAVAAARPQSSDSLFESAESEPEALNGSPHPTTRHVATCLALVLVMVIGQYYWISVRSLIDQRKQLKAQVTKNEKLITRIKGNGELLMALFQQQPVQDIPVREDDPVRGEGTGLFDVVVFSDFQCPRCREFAQRLDTKIHTLFGSDMRIVFKNLPLGTDCNSRVTKNLHPSACRAAFAAEAARMQGGNQAFWAMHDRLFADQASLPLFDYRQVAAELGLSPERLLADMKSEAVAARIEEDSELAMRLGVRGTPTAFVGGRRVDSIARSSDAFWTSLHEAYRRALARRAAAASAAEASGAGPADPSAESP